MAEQLVQLNASWRVADDPPQWALQSRNGNPRENASGWAGRKYVRDRDHLLRRIRELCGKVDPEALEIIRSWPVGYVTWKLQEMEACAGPKTAPYSAISDSEVVHHRKTPDAPVSTPESDLESIDDRAAAKRGSETPYRGSLSPQWDRDR